MELVTTTRTPRKALTEDEKKAKEAYYRVDAESFSDILLEITKLFGALMDLNAALARAGPGAWLGFPDGKGGLIPFTRGNLRSARTQFQDAIKELKTYFRISIKGHREPAKPADFKATYTPVFAGEALRYFFGGGFGAGSGFGVLNPLGADQTAQGGALMSQLPRAQQGYLLRNTCTMLFYIYSRQNSLQNPDNAQFTRSDEHMNAAFGGTIAASFWSIDTPVGQGTTKKGKVFTKYNKVKVPMGQAVADGIIPAVLNTYGIIESKFPFANGEGFDPQNRTGQNPTGYFNTYFYQNIASLNQFNRTTLRTSPEYAAIFAEIESPAVRQDMLNEHEIVKQTSAQWTELLAPTRKDARDARAKAKPKKPKAEKKVRPARLIV